MRCHRLQLGAPACAFWLDLLPLTEVLGHAGLQRWRQTARANLSGGGQWWYNSSELGWASGAFLQPQTMAHDRFLFDNSRERGGGEGWTVDRYLDDLDARYGEEYLHPHFLDRIRPRLSRSSARILLKVARLFDALLRQAVSSRFCSGTLTRTSASVRAAAAGSRAQPASRDSQHLRLCTVCPLLARTNKQLPAFSTRPHGG